jgi:predicted ATPase/DNA-binding SARP family transcriptional activator
MVVRLLGSASIKTEQDWTSFQLDKRHQLLAYLAYQQDWVSREYLAYLFYPDTSTEQGRHNLRNVLRRMQSVKWLEGLETNRDYLRWQVETDVMQFNKALENDALEEALSLYKGSLLQGLESGDNNEFVNWLEAERTKLHSKWRNAVLQYAEQLSTLGHYSKSAEVLGKLLETDNLDEEALKSYMTIMAQAGKTFEALEAYKGFQNRLQDELGLEPTSSTEQLATNIRTGTLVLEAKPVTSSVAVAERPERFLPVPAQAIIGRELELSSIIHRFSEENCRLVTLLGTGGVGKTRLALEAAHELEKQYKDGVFFIVLDSVTSASAIPLKIAETLELDPHTENVAKRVIDGIGDEEILLILDNFEHLLDDTTFISNLLRYCPKLHLLVTSRERLNLEEEWLLPLQGLSYAKESSSLEEAVTSDAVNLFVQRAKRVQPHFSLTEETLNDVLEICRLVDGTPLGLELAAVWVRAMTPKEIARDITYCLDFLRSDSRNLPKRQQSIRAVFDHSWKLLTAKEQDVLRKLSIFQGGFEREAANSVAGAPVAVLAALLDKSLLEVDNTGRYRFHPLLQQYAREELSKLSDEETDTKKRHASYYWNFVESIKGNRIAQLQPQTLSRLETELGNLRSALDWGIANNDTAFALKFCSNLGAFWFRRGYFSEGRTYCKAALALPQTPPDEPRARVLLYAGSLANRQGDYQEAKTFFEASLELSKNLNLQHGIASIYHNLGGLAYRQGDFTLAKRYYQKTLEMDRRAGDQYRLAYSLLSLGITMNVLGETEEAEPFILESLKLARSLNYGSLIAGGLCELGRTREQQGQWQEARRLYEESLGISRDFKDVYNQAHTLHRVGILAFKEGDYTNAFLHAEESLSLFTQQNERHYIAFVQHLMAMTLLKLGKPKQDIKLLLQDSLEIHRGLVIKNSGELFACLARFVSPSQPHQAATLLGIAEQFKDSLDWMLEPSQTLQKQLCTELGFKTFNQIVKEGNSLDQARAYTLAQQILQAV